MAQAAGAFRLDPLGYVMWAFPWDAEQSIQLVRLQGKWKERYPNCEWGPDAWQCEFLERLGREVESRGFDVDEPTPVNAVRMAVASGHGIGKSALTGMLVCWLMDTHADSRGMITANTGTQLRTKTFAQIVKWRKLAITAHWYEISSGDMYVRHKANREGWRCDGITWRRHESEAFAGQHEASSSSWYVFDEGSAIDDEIYRVAEGGLTDGEPFFFVFGNPTRNSGSFHRCFHAQKHRWIGWQIDSRNCGMTNKAQIQQWEEDYGEDSNFFRIRVRGAFPKAGSKQFIANDIVRAAQLRQQTAEKMDPVIVGVDVARFGHNEIVLAVRRGLDARRIEWKIYRELDTMQLASRVAELCNDLRIRGLPVSAVCVDSTGIGAGVYDRLQQMGYPAFEVNFGGSADSKKDYLRKDAEMWGRMREWLKAGGSIPNDESLATQLTTREYDFNGKMQLYLQSKDELEEMQFESPDRADALACTFAYHFASRTPQEIAEQGRTKWDYDPYKED
jgi:hypothetical protein